MGEQKYRGVIILEKPQAVDYFEFIFNHLDCDFIMAKNGTDDNDMVYVVAYADSKESNGILWALFEEKYNNGNYSIGSHISKEQMNAIV